MDELVTLREKIEAIDEEMAVLFQKRMGIAKEIAIHKKEHGLPILDENREKTLMEKNSRLIEDEELVPYYVEFLETLLDCSKSWQEKVIEGAGE